MAGICLLLTTGTVISDFREIILYPLEGGHDPLLALRVVGTEPDCVLVCDTLDALNGDACFGGRFLGGPDSRFDNILLFVQAVPEFRFRFQDRPFVVDVSGDSGTARVFNLCDALNRGVQVLGGAVSIDVSEEV